MTINLYEDKAKLYTFLSKHNIGVLSTATKDGQPHAATIYFIIDPDLNVYFITKEKTAKSRNLAENPQAALAVFEAQTQTTAQISGDVIEVKSVSRLDEVFRKILAITAKTSESTIPPVSKLQSGGYRCFSLQPKVVRLAEYLKPEHHELDGLFETVVRPDSEL